MLQRISRSRIKSIARSTERFSLSLSVDNKKTATEIIEAIGDKILSINFIQGLLQTLPKDDLSRLWYGIRPKAMSSDRVSVIADTLQTAVFKAWKKKDDLDINKKKEGKAWGSRKRK